VLVLPPGSAVSPYAVPGSPNYDEGVEYEGVAKIPGLAPGKYQIVVRTIDADAEDRLDIVVQ
jgi:hypothetical protein